MYKNRDTFEGWERNNNTKKKNSLRRLVEMSAILHIYYQWHVLLSHNFNIIISIIIIIISKL